MNNTSTIHVGPITLLPTLPMAGQTYFNTTTNQIMVFDGACWVPVLLKEKIETVLEQLNINEEEAIDLLRKIIQEKKLIEQSITVKKAYDDFQMYAKLAKE